MLNEDTAIPTLLNIWENTIVLSCDQQQLASTWLSFQIFTVFAMFASFDDAMRTIGLQFNLLSASVALI